MDPELPDITWHESPPPPGMPVTQVYTWALDPDDGRVLIQDRGEGLEPGRSRYNLPGGRPEPEDDGDPLKTAAREALEESQIHLDVSRAVYLGYQEISEDPNRPEPYAQLRYAAPIIAYDPIGPDPDTADGRINRRYLVSLKRAPELLGWGDHGVEQAKAAFRAGEKLGFPVGNPSPDGYRDGEKHRAMKQAGAAQPESGVQNPQPPMPSAAGCPDQPSGIVQNPPPTRCRVGADQSKAPISGRPAAKRSASSRGR